MYIGVDVKYPLFLSDFNETWIFWQVFEKYSNVKFHEQPSSGSQVVPCGQTEGQANRRTDKHNEANGRFRNFANATKKERNNHTQEEHIQELITHKLI